MMSTQLVASQVDPRDVRGEVENPVYRVYFVESNGATDEWRLTGCQLVDEAVSWACADGRRFDFFVEYPVADGVALLRLRPAADG